MAKLTITHEFDTDNMSSEDRQLLERLNKNMAMAMALWDIRHNMIRDVQRNLDADFARNPSKEITYNDAIEAISEAIDNILDEHGIRVDAMID